MKLIKDLGMLYATAKSKQKRRFGIFECSCGNTFKAQLYNVKKGKSKKCVKCKKVEHGYSGTRLHNIWKNMRQRVMNPNNNDYKNYGGFGITICSEWGTFIPFREWSLLNGYKDPLTIERKNNKKGYNPLNCTWIPRSDQSKNRRKLFDHNTSGSRGVTYLKDRNAWMCRIMINSKSIFIGQFGNKKDAAIAYDNYVDVHSVNYPKNFT